MLIPAEVAAFHSLRSGALLKYGECGRFKIFRPGVKRRVVKDKAKALSQAGERPDNIRLIQVIGEDIDGHTRVGMTLLKEAKERLPCMGAEPPVLLLERCGLVVNGL